MITFQLSTKKNTNDRFFKFRTKTWTNPNLWTYTPKMEDLGLFREIVNDDVHHTLLGRDPFTSRLETVIPACVVIFPLTQQFRYKDFKFCGFIGNNSTMMKCLPIIANNCQDGNHERSV
jgi:hypothetical protein